MNARPPAGERAARKNNYRLRIQPVRLGTMGHFQVRIGLEGDNHLDYIPVHRSAFAERFQLEIAHAERNLAEVEALMLAELLDCPLQA